MQTTLEPTRLGTGQYLWQVPAGWEQGRGAFGGAVIGAMVRAIELDNSSDNRTVRSIAAELPAPVQVGAATITVTVMRRGNAVSTVRAELYQTSDQGEDLRAHLVATLGSPRSEPLAWQTATMPAAPAAQSLTPIAMPPPLGPAFAQHFDFRVVHGVPYTQSQPNALGYIAPKRAIDKPSVAHLAALADCWWPCILPTLRAPRPTATLSYFGNVCQLPAALGPATPLLHSATSQWAGDGFAAEARCLWDADGRLLFINQQTFVVIK